MFGAARREEKVGKGEENVEARGGILLLGILWLSELEGYMLMQILAEGDVERV